MIEIGESMEVIAKRYLAYGYSAEKATLLTFYGQQGGFSYL